MNQATNLTQYKNLTDEVKSDYNFEGYQYELQCIDGSWATSLSRCFDDISGNIVYRLKIEPEKWYYWKRQASNDVCLGSWILDKVADCIVDTFLILRPAKPSEIPETKPETLEDRVKAEYGGYDVVMLDFDDDDLLHMRSDPSFIHISAQSMNGFYKYVYERKDGSIFTYIRPACTIREGYPDEYVLQPIAVLSEKVVG